jgi:cation diffusion facilitator CzcD-associated flavoprotein CzcO
VSTPVSGPLPAHVHVAIVGTGFAGLGMAIRLLQDGETDFVVLERANDVGGTWRDNSYPGCACDVQSHLYSFSFAPNPGWSRSYSPQGEILDYLRGCAQRYGVMPHVRFGHDVRRLAWDAQAQVWRIETSQGALTADAVVSGIGAFSEPSIPELPGLAQFGGTTFHSARWNHEHDLRGRNVAVIGTGASAIQFVPEIQRQVGKLHLFQRTAPWVLPRRNAPLGDFQHALYKAFPPAQQLARGGIYAFREAFQFGFRHPDVMRVLERLARRYLEHVVTDPVLRAKLTPDYRIGCKRILLSTRYIPSLTKPNVEVVTDRIREVRSGSIVAEDGVERPVDTIIFGTGFHVTEMPYGRYVIGAGGRSLDDAWQGSPKAHLGTTISGFPNFFVLLGPNTGLGHTSVIYMIESQIEHALNALRYMRKTGVAAVEPRAEAQAAYVAAVDARMEGTVWTSGGCSSYYLDRTGRNSSLWPDMTWKFRRRVARFDPAEYVLHRRNASVTTAPAVVRYRGLQHDHQRPAGPG